MNTGVPASRARRKISITSRSVAAIGLSMNSGFLAAMTGRACSKCGRPSTLWIKTASTSSHNCAIVGTSFTPNFSVSVRVNSSTRVALHSTSGLNVFTAAMTFAPET